MLTHTTNVTLNGSIWEFRQHGKPDEPWRGAIVPGCVHTDLLRHGLIKDPFYGTNELDLQWIEEQAWDYRCSVTLDASLWKHENLDLVLDGLDTVATVRVNGRVVLESENMFHRHRVAVRDALKPGVNEITVHFGSALHYIRTHRTEFVPKFEFNDPVGNCVRIRKEQRQFGWDWGPRFVTCGLWREARIEAWSGNRIESAHITQKHESGKVTLHVTPELARPGVGVVRGVVKRSGQVVAKFEHDRAVIEQPRLWWPAGQGEQALYDVELEVVVGDKVVSKWSRQIGLRTIELDMAEDGIDCAGPEKTKLTRFGLRVNGRLVFAKGANWIPAHAFVAGLSRADYEPLLRSARDANMNLMRLWGGGIYEHDAFYDVCDELGLLVWHDFMFACTLYPGDDAFVESVRREAMDQVRRVRHHASLALWCGNNEVAQLNMAALTEQASYRDAYERVFVQTLPGVLSKMDPATPYLHSSPAMAVPGLLETVLPSQDAHDWNVWHAGKPVEHYEGTNHRFCSEFGMQSYPSQRIAETFCPEGELNVFSPTFENHQKHGAGNQVIFDYVSRLYRFPKDYRSTAYLSQLNQAYCMKVGIEHFRRSSPACLGAVYWQLNDCWPVASWSSIEFGGAWKALQYAARRFFAPALVSVRHIGKAWKTRGNYTKTDTGVVDVYAVQDGPSAIEATLAWSLIKIDGLQIESGRQDLTLEPMRGKVVSRLDLTDHVERVGRARVLLRVSLLDGSGRVLSEDTVLFTAPRNLELARESIDVAWDTTDSDQPGVTLRSKAYHHRVCLELGGMGARWSDNFFDLFPGEPKRVELIEYDRSQKDLTGRLSVFSLVDSFVG